MATVISQPGDLTPGLILQVQAKAEEMWQNGQWGAEFEPDAASAQALISHQTATFEALEDPNVDNTMKITWVNTCDVTDEAYVEECDITGNEASINSMTAELDIKRQVTVKIDLEKLRTNKYSRTELLTRLQMEAVKELDEFWNKTVLAKFKAFAGVNLYPGKYNFDPSENTTEIPEAEYNRKIIAYFIATMQRNKIKPFYMVDNGQFLYEDYINASFDSANSEGKGDGARINALDKTFDLFGFTDAGIDEDTFMIGNGAVAMATQNRYDTTPTEIRGKVNETVYKVASRAFPGIFYDVVYQLKCEVSAQNGGASKKRYIEIWKYSTFGGVFLNPASCNGTTGVLSFTQVG